MMLLVPVVSPFTSFSHSCSLSSSILLLTFAIGLKTSIHPVPLTYDVSVRCFLRSRGGEGRRSDWKQFEYQHKHRLWSNIHVTVPREELRPLSRVACQTLRQETGRSLGWMQTSVGNIYLFVSGFLVLVPEWNKQQEQLMFWASVGSDEDAESNSQLIWII